MSEISRRHILAGAGAAIGAAAVAGCAAKAESTATTSPASSPSSGGASSGGASPGNGGSLEMKVGRLADVPVGGGSLVSVGGNDLVVTQPVAGQPAVFLNRCTHQGCKVAVQGAQLICPCHGSRYDLTGAVVNGPATQPLPPATLRVDNGVIIVEKL